MYYTRSKKRKIDSLDDDAINTSPLDIDTDHVNNDNDANSDDEKTKWELIDTAFFKRQSSFRAEQLSEDDAAFHLSLSQLQSMDEASRVDEEDGDALWRMHHETRGSKGSVGGKHILVGEDGTRIADLEAGQSSCFIHLGAKQIHASYKMANDANTFAFRVTVSPKGVRIRYVVRYSDEGWVHGEALSAYLHKIERNEAEIKHYKHERIPALLKSAENIDSKEGKQAYDDLHDALSWKRNHEKELAALKQRTHIPIKVLSKTIVQEYWLRERGVFYRIPFFCNPVAWCTEAAIPVTILLQEEEDAIPNSSVSVSDSSSIKEEEAESAENSGGQESFTGVKVGQVFRKCVKTSEFPWSSAVVPKSSLFEKLSLQKCQKMLLGNDAVLGVHQHPMREECHIAIAHSRVWVRVGSSSRTETLEPYMNETCAIDVRDSDGTIAIAQSDKGVFIFTKQFELVRSIDCKGTHDVCFGHEGQLYFIDNGCILRTNPYILGNVEPVVRFNSPRIAVDPLAMAFDTKNKFLVVSERNKNVLYVLDIASGACNVLENLGDCNVEFERLHFTHHGYLVTVSASLDDGVDEEDKRYIQVYNVKGEHLYTSAFSSEMRYVTSHKNQIYAYTSDSFEYVYDIVANN